MIAYLMLLAYLSKAVCSNQSINQFINPVYFQHSMAYISYENNQYKHPESSQYQYWKNEEIEV